MINMNILKCEISGIGLCAKFHFHFCSNSQMPIKTLFKPSPGNVHTGKLFCFEFPYTRLLKWLMTVLES